MQQLVAEVRAELLIEANQAIAQKRGKGDRTITIVVALADEHSSDELLAVTYRLQALRKLIM